MPRRDLYPNRWRSLNDRDRAGQLKPSTESLLNQAGIGPAITALALAAWSHPGRIHAEAVLSSVASVNPIPRRPRTPSGAESTAAATNASTMFLHMAVVTRIRMDPDTSAYVAKRTAERRTPREIR